MSYDGAAILVAVVVLALGLGEGVRRVLAKRRGGTFEDLMASAALGWACLSWWGVVLAETGQFAPRIFLGVPAFLAAALWVAPRDLRPGRWRLDPAAVAVVVLVVVLAASLFFPVFDVRLEARDPGTYFHAGRYLASHGTLNFVDPTVTRLGPETRAAMFPPVGGHERAFHNSRYLGFYLEELETGRVVPQAAPVYPVWTGVGHWVAGDRGALGVAAVLMAFGACLLSALGVAFAGRIGLLAGPLFAAGIVPGWFARYSAAESAALVAVVLATLGLARYREHNDRFYGLAAGVGFGLALLAKAELLFVVGPLAALFFFDVVTRRITRRDVVYLWLPFGLLSVHMVVHAGGWLWPYYFDVVRQYVVEPRTFLALAAAAAVAAVAVTALVRRVAVGHVDGIRRLLSGESAAGMALRWCAAAGVVAFAIYGYWWRPYIYTVDPTINGWNMANHVQLGLVISPWFVFLCALGAVLVIVRKDERPGIEVAAMVLLVLALHTLYERNIIPRTMWAYRRYVPIVLPIHYLLSLLAIDWVARRLARWRLPVGVTALVLLAPVIWHQATIGRGIREHREFPGAEAALAQLTDVLTPDDAVLFEPRTTRGQVRFEAAVGLDGSPAVYRLPQPDPDYPALRSIATDRARAGGAVYLVTTGYLNGLTEVGAEPVTMLDWETEMLEEVATHREVARGGAIRLPEHTVPMRFEARVYRLDPDGRLAPLPERAVAGELRGELDVGLWDEPYLMGRWLHVPEYAGIHNFRWSTDQAGFLLAGIPATAEAVILRVTANEQLPAQQVEAWLDDVYLGSAPVPDDWGDVRFAIPEVWSRPENGIAHLRVEVPAGVPSEIDPSLSDRRTLGIRVDKVFWARAEPVGER